MPSDNPDVIFRFVADEQQVLLLPPPSEGGARKTEVKFVAHNLAGVGCTITEVGFTPSNAQQYFELGDFCGLNVPANGKKELTLHLVNPSNPEAMLRGRMEISVRWDQQAPTAAGPADHTPKAPFQLRPFPTFQGIFVMDYGTTNSVCVVLPSGYNINDNQQFRALSFEEPSSSTPAPEAEHRSAIVFNTVEGRVEDWDVEVGDEVVGSFQDVLARDNPDPRLLQAFIPGGVKRLLGKVDEQLAVASARTGKGRTLSADEANGKIVQRFVRRSEEYRRFKQALPLGKIERIVATHPVNFTPQQVRSLRQAYARFVGLDEKFINLRYDEATAAAIYFVAQQLYDPTGRRLHEFWARCDQPDAPAPATPEAPEKRVFNMLVFDCGGGTTDIALMQVEAERHLRYRGDGRTCTGNWFIVRPRVIGLTGEKYFAGDNMTFEVFKILRYRLAEKMARTIGAIAPDAERWEERDLSAFQGGLNALKEKLLRPGPGRTGLAFADSVEELCLQVVPTDWRRHAVGSRADGLRRNFFYTLWNLAEKAKKDLADPAKRVAEVSLRDLSVLEHYKAGAGTLQEADGFDSVTITREELDGRLGPAIHNAWELARDLCEDHKNLKVHQVVLAGNGSRYHLVKEKMKEVFADGKIFAFQEHRVLSPGPDAKRAVAKGAAVAEWYGRYKPDDLTRADQPIVAFEVDANPVLPYSLYFDATSGRELLFKRGRPFPAARRGPDGGEGQELEECVPAVDFLVMYQSVRDHPQEKRTMIPYCQFDATAAQAPARMPPGAVKKLLVRVNRENEIKASAVWELGEERLGEPVALTMQPLPADPAFEMKNPFSGLH